MATGWARTDYVNCTACTKARASLELMGGKEVTVLLKHEAKEEDTLEETIAKVEAGMIAETNQATSKLIYNALFEKYYVIFHIK